MAISGEKVKNFTKKLEQTESLSEIFELVKEVVKDIMGKERTGLMVGLAELGGRPGVFIGAFYPVGSNLIVMNKTPLRVVEATKPKLFKSYCFHILLHEYLHTIGILDERYAHGIAYVISAKTFGENHPTSLIAKDFNRIFPEVMYASLDWQPNNQLEIELVKDIESENIRYIG